MVTTIPRVFVLATVVIDRSEAYWEYVVRMKVSFTAAPLIVDVITVAPGGRGLGVFCGLSPDSVPGFLDPAKLSAGRSVVVKSLEGSPFEGID